MNRVLSKVLGITWSLGTRLDRALKTAHRLPHPVISVGNIASGGRAKTPLVIELVHGLRARGHQPVVLMRGYGRASQTAIEISLQHSDVEVEDCGDEALEIFVKTSATVLVGANRHSNALKFLERAPRAPYVFVLDDGFQHWSLMRDLDIVVVTPGDLQDQLIPVGRLRETPEALTRAQIFFTLGKNLRKVSSVQAHLPLERPFTVLSTRAPDPAYKDFFSHHKDVDFVELRDHAPRRAVEQALDRIKPGRAVCVGAKEAVKLLPSNAALKQFFSQGQIRLDRGLSQWSGELIYVDCRLEWDASLGLWERVEKSLKIAKGSTS